MKKLISFFTIALFLAIPLAANADYLGTGNLQTSASDPIVGSYYGDYDGRVTASSFGYTIPWSEIFCVSGDENTDPSPYAFYRITNELITGLDAKFGAGTFNKLSQVAWIGDHWDTDFGPVTDTLKVEAQKAVWKIVWSDYTGGIGTDWDIYQASTAHIGETNYNWYYAYSPAVEGQTNYQDFITPVPEPGILILLGLAMSAIGAASWRLRKL